MNTISAAAERETNLEFLMGSMDCLIAIAETKERFLPLLCVRQRNLGSVVNMNGCWSLSALVMMIELSVGTRKFSQRKDM